MTFLVYLYLIVYAIVCISIFTIGVEQMVCFAKRQAPSVPSNRGLRKAVVKQIKEDLPEVKTILDIGSGWGTMVRSVAKNNPNAKVTGIEIMPTPFVYSIVRGIFSRNSKIIFGDAFKYLEKGQEQIDLGITYLLTPEMKNVERFLSRFKVLYALDFPLPDVKPYKKIKLHKDMFAQHWLYIYKQ